MRSIANQLQYGLVAVIVSSVLIVGSILTYLSSLELAEQTKLLQQERAQGAAHKISAYLDNLQRQLNFLSELRGFTEFSPEVQQSILEGLTNSNSAYEMAGLINSQGQVLQVRSPYEPLSPTHPIFASFSVNSPLFLAVFRKGQNYISPVTLDSKTQLAVVTLGVPIRDSQDQVSGILFAKINLGFLAQIVAGTQVGKTGYTYVLDNQLTLIAQKDRVANYIALSDLKNRSFVQNLFKLAISNKSQPITTYQGLKGEAVVGTATLVRRVQWIVVVELPLVEVYAPLRGMLLVIGGATLIAIIAGVILGIIFARSIILPLKLLAKATSKISQGQLNSRVKIPATNELGELAQSFNRMASELQASFANVQDHKQQLAQFLEAMPVGVFIVNAQGQPYYVNSRAQELLGKGTVAGAMAEELTAVYQVYLAGGEQLYPKERDPVTCALRGESVSVDDMEIYQSDKVIPIETWGRPIFDAHGNIVYAIAAFQDITERKQNENFLSEYNRILEVQVAERTHKLSQALTDLKATQQELIQSEKMAALGQLIAGVAHEINTPLGAIRSSVENLTDFFNHNLSQLPKFFQQLTSSRAQDFFTLLQKSAQQTPHLSSKEKRKIKKDLTQQLESEKIENAELIADTLVDLGFYSEIEFLFPLLKDSESPKILHRAYQLASLQKSAATIKIATDRAAKIVFALKSYARYDRSGQKTLTNLTEGIETVLTLYHNQLKQGVEVVRNYQAGLPAILVYPDELNQVWTNLIHNALQAMNYQGILKIDVRQQEAEIQVSFTDNGPGIPPEILPKIFDPFFTTKPPGEGSGLGLDIVRKNMDKHQGKIEIESQPGTTVFRLYLPLTA